MFLLVVSLELYGWFCDDIDLDHFDIALKFHMHETKIILRSLLVTFKAVCFRNKLIQYNIQFKYDYELYYIVCKKKEKEIE